MNIIFRYEASLPSVDRSEALRYAGVRGPSPETDTLLEQCIDEIGNALHPRLCYCELPLQITEDTVVFGTLKSSSKTMIRFLTGCDRIILFAATLGIEIDRLIVKYSRIAPSKALLLQAIGAERIEAFCDTFCNDIARQKALEHRSTSKRFSPGYGDVPLNLQTELFELLNCPKNLGLTLNQSLLMSPTKSVTALIGIKKQHSTD